MNPIDFLATADGLGSGEANDRTAIGRYYYGAFNHLRDELRARHSVNFTGKASDHALLRNNIHLLDTGPSMPHGPTARALLETLRSLRNKADYELGIHVTPQDRADAQQLVQDIRMQTGKW